MVWRTSGIGLQRSDSTTTSDNGDGENEGGRLVRCVGSCSIAWASLSTTVRLAVDGGLLVIVLVSLAIGMPFTLQYARESVPKEFWTVPLFITTNQRITAAWAAAFAVMTAADAATRAG